VVVVAHAEIRGGGYRRLDGLHAVARRGVPMTAIDPRLVWLDRAAIAHVLVGAGEITLDEAFEGLAPGFDALRPCACAREYTERLEQYRPRARRTAA
jgi:hypothetical protein